MKSKFSFRFSTLTNEGFLTVSALHHCVVVLGVAPIPYVQDAIFNVLSLFITNITTRGGKFSVKS